MVKEKRILSYFIGWLLLGFIVCFIGVNKIFALTTTEYEDITYLNDYTIYYVKADYTSSPLQLQPTNEYQLEQVTGFIVNVDNYSFNAGVTYNIEISMPLNTLTNANRYTVTGDNNMTCSVTQIDNTNPNFPNFTFNCPNTTRNITLNIFNSNGNYIVNTGLFRWNYTFLRKQITTLDLGILENQQSQIIDQNNQIIQGQEDIENAIIDSNKETQEVIKDQFNNCHDSYNLINVPTIALNKTTNRTLIINLPNSLTPGTYTLSYKFNSTLNPSARVEVLNGSTQEALFSLSSTGSNTFTIDNTVTRLYFYITNSSAENSTILLSDVMLNQGSSPKKYEPYGEEICSNKIDETNDKLDETNNQLGDLNNNLTDNSPTDMSGLGDSAGWLPAGPVDSILTLPLTMLNNLVSNLSSQCQTVSIKLPFVNKYLNLPCIKSLYDKIGITGTLFQSAGLIASAFILFNYLLALYKWVDDTLTMRENTMPGYFDDNWGGGA